MATFPTKMAKIVVLIKTLCFSHVNYVVLVLTLASLYLHMKSRRVCIKQSHLYLGYLTTDISINLRNRAEYHLILSPRGRKRSWLNQGIFRKIERDNCFIIQHFQNEKNYGSMMKTLKASNT